MGSDGIVGSQRQTCLPRDCQVEAVFFFSFKRPQTGRNSGFSFSLQVSFAAAQKKRKELNGKDSAEPDIFFLTKTT